MSAEQNPGGSTSKGSSTVAAIIGGIAIVAGVTANLKTIEDFFSPLFVQGEAVGPKQPAPASPAVEPTIPPSPMAKKVYKICMGNGGGTNCLSGADAKYDCNYYNSIGGGGAKTYQVLGDTFCAYKDAGGTTKIAPHDIIVIQNNGGGQCGWTAFQVTCN